MIRGVLASADTGGVTHGILPETKHELGIAKSDTFERCYWVGTDASEQVRGSFGMSNRNHFAQGVPSRNGPSERKRWDKRWDTLGFMKMRRDHLRNQ
jgi:hypothetical protein